jgi:hypothetical protein
MNSSKSCRSRHLLNNQSAQLLRVAPSNAKNRVVADRRVPPLRVPPGKVLKAQSMLVQGHSNREISRTLHMSTHTVAQIVRTPDFQQFIQEQREQLFGIAPVALESFRSRVALDGNLAYAFLKDLGIIPSREDINLIKSVPTQTESGFQRQARLVANLLLEGHENFNIDLPKDIERALAEDAREHGQVSNSKSEPREELRPWK